MFNNYKSFLYLFDLLGIVPQLRVLNYENYKTIFSSFLSIIILLISIAFSIYSFVIYLKFENPNVIYSKDNDKTTNRTILIKDTLLMFSLIDSSFKTINDQMHCLKVFMLQLIIMEILFLFH